MTRPLPLVFVAFLALSGAVEAQTPTPTTTTGPAAGTFDPKKKYSGVVLQQGRVQTDADWNEQVQACRHENEELKRQLETLRAENLSLRRRLAVPLTVHTPTSK